MGVESECIYVLIFSGHELMGEFFREEKNNSRFFLYFSILASYSTYLDAT
jgi:hypothetical protein